MIRAEKDECRLEYVIHFSSRVKDLNYGKDFKVEKRGPFLAKGSMRAKLKT